MVMLQRWLLMEGEWSFYRGQYNGGRMVMSYGGGHFKWRENGHVTEVVSLMEGEWSCYEGQRWPV